MSGQPSINVSARAHLAVVLLETTQVTVADVAALVRVSECQVYRAWRAAHPDRPPRGRRITEAMRAAKIEPFAALCDVMAEQLTDRPQRAAQIFAATRVMHGDVGERRIWRALRRLVDTGRVARHGMRCTGATYTRIINGGGTCER